MRIGTKSLLGLSFKQVGLWFIHPLSFGSSPPLSRLWSRLLRHPAFPLVHQLFPVRTLDTFYHMILCLYLLCRSCGVKYTRLRFVASLYWCGAWEDIRGGISSSGWGKETNSTYYTRSHNKHILEWQTYKRQKENNLNKSISILFTQYFLI